MTNSKRALCATSTLAFVLAPTAFAQSGAEASSEAPDATQDHGRLEVIVVTARRREEDVQSTPVTLTAFSGEDLQEKGISDFTRLAQATPGINFDTFPKSAPRPVFRGIGSSNQGAGGDPSSVAFLDGVYLGRAAMLGIDFYDMERVEILKGPQGTLWGKNVAAGAINFITAKPTNERQGSASLGFGEFGQKNLHLMYNLPLTDSVAARAVVGSVQNDGFRKTADGRALDDEDMQSARVQLRAEFTGGASLLISGDIADQDLSDSSRFNLINNPFTPGRGYADFSNPRVTNPDHLGYTKSTTGGLRAEFNTPALGVADWTTTAAWRTLDYDFSNDLDNTDPAGNVANGVVVTGLQILAPEEADSYSLESRLTSISQGPLSWVLGVYYNNDEVHRERETQQSATPTTVNRFFGDSSNESYAAFGEAQYQFSSGLRLLAGGRYTQERKEYAARRLTGSIAAPTVSYDTASDPGIFDEGVFTYRVGADHRFNDNVFVFGTLSTGFKSGAFPEQPPNDVLARRATDPEKTTNYEIGVKSDWLNGTLRANVSVFRMDYRDFQTIKVVPDATQGPAGTRVVTDTADAKIEGIETELSVNPVDWFDATVRYAYLDAHFTRFIQTSAFLADGSPVFTDGVGKRLSRTPEHAVVTNVGLQTSQSEAWGWLRLDVTMDYQSEVFENSLNDFNEYRVPRTLWNASLTYHINDELSVQLWGHNLTDEVYRTWQTFSAPAHYHFVQYGPPRQLGVTFNASF
ncbi:MAG TPA: TonB-dependent receptor [Steroidobacter sp.]|uniref:TonB-dependent receptor n=1 Tax=Steroidobacter sp. TaxID=1978227 RepID=UPI002ED95FD1